MKGRNRTIKPALWNDSRIGKVSYPAHLLFIGLWNFSDDTGVVEHNPYFMKQNIFPVKEDATPATVCEWLQELIQQRFIIPFCYQEKEYILIRPFTKHQV